MYTYVHDLSARTVYKFIAPKIRDETDNRRRVTGWSFSLDIQVTRADNLLQAGTWLHPTGNNPTQSFDKSRYSREIALSYFRQLHEPKGVVIDENAYALLYAEYDGMARSKKA